MKRLYVDIGSTNIKSAVSAGAECEGVERVAFPAPAVDGNSRFEVDVDKILERVHEIVDRAACEEVYISTQMHGYLLADAQRRPVTRYISWQDRRAQACGIQLKIAAPSGTAMKGNLPRAGVEAIRRTQPEMCIRDSPMYARLTSAIPEECVTFNNYLLYNLKAAVNPYTYNKSIMDYTYDTSASNYVRMVNLKSTLEKLWTDNFAEIITQSSAQEASAKYDEILASARAYGLQTYMEYQNASFRAYKRKFGIEGCGWIKNLDSYTEPEVKLLGDVSQNIEIPSRLYP